MERIYEYKTEPFPHQREWFEKTRDKEAFGIFWEQGVAKTKLMIDTAAWLFEGGDINCVIVVAPTGVHEQWVAEQLPIHMPDRAIERTNTLIWHSRKANTLANKAAMERLLTENDRLAFLTIGYEGYITTAAQAFLTKLRKYKNVLMILDEAHCIQSPGAKRTKKILAQGAVCKYRRILTGTPLGNGPLPAYSQIKFLDRGYWKERQLASYAAFKSYFADTYWHPDGYEIIRGYQRLDVLEKMLEPMTSRLTTESAGVVLPPKLYAKLPFHMTPPQARAYKKLRDEFLLELESGETVDAQLALTRMLRLQQIVCGYVPSGLDAEPFAPIDPKSPNPRIEAMKALVEQWPHQGTIWARFQHDITQIIDALGEKRCARYDGAISQEEAGRNLNDFRSGAKQYLVANPAKGGTGLNLQMGKSVCYYSNSFKLIDRLQSEKRSHRPGQDVPVNITDIYCPGTIDTLIIENLRRKNDVATTVLGDIPREWI